MGKSNGQELTETHSLQSLPRRPERIVARQASPHHHDKLPALEKIIRHLEGSSVDQNRGEGEIALPRLD